VPTPSKTIKLTELRRRRCVNCNRLYKPRKEHQRFCTDAVKDDPNHCRREFNRHGSAFGPLKIKLEKLVMKTVREILENEHAFIVKQLADLEKRFITAEPREPSPR